MAPIIQEAKEGKVRAFRGYSSLEQTIVISAVNLRKGGTLTILRQCLAYLSELAQRGEYRVIALVHKRELADYSGIEYIELPWAADSWLKRLWCEYVTMGSYARWIGEIDLWLSLHDTTPRVKARKQVVYCQTSFPFLRWKWADFRFDPKIPLFAMFTRFAYQIGIKRNRYLIVQQEWLREGFSRMFSIPKERFLVAPPARDRSIPEYSPIPSDGVFTFFFASTADSHKNFETLAEATHLLEERIGKGRFRTIITVAGTENKYARYLYEHWGRVSSLEFAGLMDKPTLFAHYERADCLVFPSRIETWGLPITEYMQTQKNEGIMLLADLPYAHETSRGAEQVAFFPATDANALSQLMEKTIEGTNQYQAIPPATNGDLLQDWEELFKQLLSK